MKKILHFHIPKTGGRYLSQATIPFLNYDCKVAGIDSRYSLDTNHGGWNEVDNDTYVYTTFRNPINRTISHYLFYRPYLEIEDTVKVKDQILEDIHKTENEYLNNYQVKFLTNTEGKVEEVLDQEFNYDLSLLNERLNRLNFVSKIEDISEIHINRIYRESCDWLGIEPNYNKIVYPRSAQTTFMNLKSKEVLEILTEDEKDEILSLNFKDHEIYKNIIGDIIE